MIDFERAALDLFNTEASVFTQPKVGLQTGPSRIEFLAKLRQDLSPAFIPATDIRAIMAVYRDIRVFRRGNLSELVEDFNKVFGIRIAQNGHGPTIDGGGFGIFHQDTAAEAMAGFRTYYDPYLSTYQL